MVIFQGQTPTINNILGGVRGGASRDIDVSSHVTDFGVGGFMILRGITLDQYNANKSNLSLARIEYSAMATYGQGKKFRTEIMPNYMGDYAYRVTNIGRIGMELRKDSPDGEKVVNSTTLQIRNESSKTIDQVIFRGTFFVKGNTDVISTWTANRSAEDYDDTLSLEIANTTWTASYNYRRGYELGSGQGTWKRNGNSLTFTPASGSYPKATGILSLSGDTLTIRFSRVGNGSFYDVRVLTCNSTNLQRMIFPGEDAKKSPEAGSGYIYFKINSTSYRTQSVVAIEEGEKAVGHL